MKLAPRSWNFVVSCYEPLGAVTGGIGTYTRLLLHRIASLHDNVLAFTAADEVVDLPANVTLVSVPGVPKLAKRDLNNLADHHFAYSFHLSRLLQSLQAEGHSFEWTEFPDYGNDGFFALCLRKAGILDLGHVSVRLHSPVLMLREDNLWPRHLTPLDMLHHCSGERFVLGEVDSILYGETAMLERVLSFFDERTGSLLRAKSLQSPHPWPAPIPGSITATHPDRDADGNTIEIGLVGRLEVRKGSYEMIRLWDDQRALKPEPGLTARYHFVGGTTADWAGRSVERVVSQHIAEKGIGDNVVLHGKQPQEMLPILFAGLDGLLYPSRFENYPNALIEAMQLGKPVLVSSHGCMPDLIKNYPDGRTTDPLRPDVFAADVAEFVRALALQRPIWAEREAARRAAYLEISQEQNRNFDSFYQSAPVPTRVPTVEQRLSVAFVVPHFRQSHLITELLDDIEECLKPGDEVVVVDDASGPEERVRLEGLIKARGKPFRVVFKSRNEGPGAARDDGVRLTTADAVQFCDADDRLVPSEVATARSALVRNAELDAVFGVMEAFGDLDHFWVPTLPNPELSWLRNFAHSAGLFRRTVFDQVGGYPRQPLAHYEDWLFNLRLLLLKIEVLVIPLVTMRYRVKLGSSRSQANAALVHHSYQAIVDSALATSAERQIAFDHNVLMRMIGRAYLLETVTPDQTPGVKPRRYELADRMVEFLWGKPRISRLAKSVAHRILKSSRR